MDSKHIRTVAELPVPKSVLDIQVFLGFSNFYRRFIEGYSRVVLPITRLLHKGQPFEWSAEAQGSFNKLKSLFTSTPIFRHFDPELPTTIHADSSGFAISGIMSQPDANGILHPIAFWSRKYIPIECNYDIHDREMLAIVKCFKHYLKGSKYPVHIHSCHKNLEIFMSTKILNHHQARWAEFLSSYDFVLDHISGLKNPADGLSRCPDYVKDVDIPSSALIPPKALQLLPPESLPSGVWPTPSNVPGAHLESALESSWSQFESIVASTSENPFRQRIISTLAKDPVADEYHQDLQPPWSYENELLLQNNLIYVPDDNSLRLELLRQHHNDSLAVHFSFLKTFELLSHIIGSPACMHMSSPMSPPAIPVPVANPHVTFNMVSSRHCSHPPVPGNQSHEISSLIYPFQMGTILSLSSSTALRRCVTLSLVSKPPTRPSSHVCSSIMSFTCTASLILLSLIMDQSLRLIFGNLSHP